MGRASNKKKPHAFGVNPLPAQAVETLTGVPFVRTSDLPNEHNLWKAVHELYELLRHRHNGEAAYQAYFERNPIVFRCLNFDFHASFEKASGNALPYDVERCFTPEPDFLCARADTGEITIFELKTPFLGKLVTARSDGNRAKLREDLARHVAQATEYAKSIQGSADARAVVRRVLKIDKISSQRITLVCGLAEANSPAEVAQILVERPIPVELLFFDTLLDRLGTAYEAKHQGVASRGGWSFTFLISFPVVQQESRAYISDYGNLVKDRISFIREENLIAFECLDSEGRLHRLAAKCTGTAPHYVRFEFSNDDGGLYMSLHVDDDEQEHKFSKLQFQCRPDLTIRVDGANLEGRCGAAFNSFQTIVINRTLTLGEKLANYSYCLEIMASKKSFLEFQAHSFMRGVAGGSMAQDIDDLKPVVWPIGVRVGLIKSKVPENAPRSPVIEVASPTPPFVS